MILGEVYITTPKIIPQRPLIQEVQELCKEVEPKPLYCELPEDLRLRSIESSGTVQMYTYANSLTTISSIGTPSAI